MTPTSGWTSSRRHACRPAFTCTPGTTGSFPPHTPTTWSTKRWKQPNPHSPPSEPLSVPISCPARPSQALVRGTPMSDLANPAPVATGDTVQESANAAVTAFGYKPELRRSLKFFSLFAVAFSVVSISTGLFLNYG